MDNVKLLVSSNLIYIFIHMYLKKLHFLKYAVFMCFADAIHYYLHVLYVITKFYEYDLNIIIV